MNQHYVLDENNNPTPSDDIEAWEWKHKFSHRCIVGITTINNIFISTVFLVVDHSFIPDQKELFESMIFCGDVKYEGFVERYATWDEAEKGHQRIIEAILAGKELE